MPIYEYECNKCGVIEVNQRIIESPLSRCPHCRGKVHRLISQTSFQLKGSGWYATDYGKGNGKGKGRGKKEVTEAAGETTTASETSKTETKTETETKKNSAAGTTSK